MNLLKKVTITDNICNICILKNKYFCYLDEYCKILKIKDFDKFKLKIDDKNSNSEINYILGLSDGRLLICSLDYLIKIIEIDYETKNYEFTNILKGHLNLITKVIELKNGKLCSCSFDGYIKLWKKNIDNSYELEINLNFFENGKFYSLLEVNEIIFSLLNYDNKKILYFMNLNKKIDGKKIIENINLKRENLIQLNNNNLIIGGIYVIYIYDINNNEETPIKCNYIICSLYLLKDNGILFGDNCGNLVKIKNIFNFEIIFKEEDDTKEEIDSLGEFDNGNKYFIIYIIKNSKILKFAEVEIQYN
jgi:WD40 repeat protein